MSVLYESLIASDTRGWHSLVVYYIVPQTAVT